MDSCVVSRLSSSVGIHTSESVAGTGYKKGCMVDNSFWNDLRYVWLGMVLRTVISTQ